MALQVLIYRISGGQLGGNLGGFKVLILTAIGRKSGKQHSIPLGYFERDGGYVIVASNNGRDSHPAWYYNLKANPAATIQVLDRVISVNAGLLSGEQRTTAWKAVVESAPQYGKYEQATTREIPLFLLKPSK